jgi:hypothetical protein
MASGYQALRGNTSGWNNTAVGVQALAANSIGANNTAVGFAALANANLTGYNNTAAGSQALENNTNGWNNTAVGVQALINAENNGNLAMGYQAGYYLSNNWNNIEIGNMGVPGDNNTIRIGTQGIQTRTFLVGSLALNGTTIIDATGNWVGSPTGLVGPQGPPGPQGPAGPAVHTSAVCSSASASGFDGDCNCNGHTLISKTTSYSTCTATSDTGVCGADGAIQSRYPFSDNYFYGSCCVCAY